MQNVLIFLTSIRMAPKIFGNVAVAQLPFEPPGFLQKLTHRGLSEGDPRECSSVSFSNNSLLSVMVVITSSNRKPNVAFCLFVIKS